MTVSRCCTNDIQSSLEMLHEILKYLAADLRRLLVSTA